MNLSKIPVITKILKPCCRHYFKYTSPSPVCPPTAPYKFTVTLMDASTNMGQALALMLKQNSLVEELRLFDDKDTIGIGMDLSDIDTSTRILAYTGEENLTEALTDTNLVINCGGHSANPFESYEDLFERNAEDVRRTAIYLTEFNRNAVFCIARPPVESLVPMVYQEYRRAGVKVPEVKIIGAANYYSMRANHWIAKFMNVDAFHVTCPIVGGASPETAIAVMSGSNPGKKLTDPRILNAIQEGMAYGEERVLGITIHEEASSAAFAPAVAAYRLINKILKGLRGDEDTYDCAFVKQEGHLKKFLPYMTSIVKFGRHGVYDTHMPDMVGSELYRLKNSYPVLRAYIHLGEKYVHGVPLPPAKLPCNRPCILTKTKTVEDQRNPLKVKIHNPADYDKCGRIEERRDYGESCNS
ncbi:malate dehydrogenase, mitochondrial-like isoform X1 [Coccinella septempunctata]|uniref:malate dehydrogenase, mitochondrial-like isoform X1 n=1 Tax=Coccinella septempunctata TaxID=41139 RepID=UPI001D06DFE7|nr:malate dehydrogenase, mitochondrial-like isoform X1 [Coccinella septempunctata]